MKALILLSLAAIASANQNVAQERFMPTCECSQTEGSSCMGAFNKKGLFTYRYDTMMEQYIPGYKGTSEFRMTMNVDFMFYENSCFGEMNIYDVMAYDTSYRNMSFSGDMFEFFKQQAERYGEMDLFYKYNETLPRYRLYFCYSDFMFGNLYQHRMEPTWSMNFKRGILSTFQTEFCPSKFTYKTMESDVNANRCPHEYKMRPYSMGNFSVDKTMFYDQCQDMNTYTTSNFYGKYFKEGEKAIFTKANTFFKYYNNATQYISYEESHEMRLSGFQFHFTADQDWGSLFTTVRQFFYFQRHSMENMRMFMGFYARDYYTTPRSMDYEQYNFYMDYNYQYDNMDEAMSMVRQITEFKRDTKQGDFLDMFYELQRRFRYFNYDQFRDMFERFGRDEMCMAFEQDGRFTCRRTFFEAVMSVGNDASAEFFKYLITEQGTFFSQEDQLFGMWSFIFSEHSSTKILDSIYDTCEFYKSDERFWGKCALALGALTRRYCEYNRCPYVDFNDFNQYTTFSQYMSSRENFMPPSYAKYFFYFYRIFYDNRNTYNYRAFFAMKAMQNMARGDFDYMRSFYTFYKSVAYNNMYPMQYRLAAFEHFAYCSEYFYEEMYYDFDRVFNDETQPTEMRIAAFNGMMYVYKFGNYYSSSEKWQRVFSVLRWTRDQQFYCYCYSYLSRMVETEYFPDRYWTRNIAYYFGQNDYYFNSQIYKCKNYGYLASQVQHYSFPAEFFPRFMDSRVVSSVEYYNNDTFTFPRRFNFQMNSYFYNQEFKNFEFGFESPDFRKVFDYFTGPDAFFFRSNENPRNMNDFKFFFFFRMFEFELLYEEFDQQYFQQTFNSQYQYFEFYRSFYQMFQNGYSYRGMSNLFYQFKRYSSFSGMMSYFTDSTYWSQTYDYSLTFRGLDYRYTVPTRMGFPIVYNMTTFFHIQTIMKGDISCDETCQYTYGLIPDRVQSKFYFEPRYAARLYGSVSFYTAFFAPSLQFEFSGFGGFNQTHNTTMYMDGRMDHDYTLPQSYTKLATFGGKTYFYYYRYQLPYRSFQYFGQPTHTAFEENDFMRPMPYFYERCHNCSWYYNFFDYSGFNFTTMSQYSNFTQYYHGYPSFPFNGDFNFTVGCMPRQYYNGRYLTDSEAYGLYRSQPRARYSFNFRNFSNYQTVDVDFYPPIFGRPAYSNRTFSYHFERRPYYDMQGFRFFNISAYGMRYPYAASNMHDHYYEKDFMFQEYFYGYTTYRDFEGDYFNWFGRSMMNTTFFYRFYNPCFNFSSYFYANSTYYNFDHRFMYYKGMQPYRFYGEGQHPRNFSGYFNMNYNNDEYYFRYNSTRRYFMNDFHVTTNFFNMDKYYSGKQNGYNMFAVMPAMDFEQCYVFDKTYTTFDGLTHNVYQGCNHYLVFNDYFHVVRIPRQSGEHYDVRVDFTQRYGGMSYTFTPNYFMMNGRRYMISEMMENREYNYEEFDVRRVMSEGCGCYRVYFHRFHFMMYYCPHSSNIAMSPFYFGRTRGICGNMNNNPDDDMMMRTSNEMAMNTRSFFHSYSHRGFCSEHRDVSSFNYDNDQYREAYSFCYQVFNKLYSHCNRTVSSFNFMNSCAKAIFNCQGSRDMCMRPTLCAYGAACYGAGYYSQNSCMVSEWQQYSTEMRMAGVRDNLPYYDNRYFQSFMLYTPSYMSTHMYPMNYDQNRCIRSRVSEWQYPTGGFRSGFQWCQGEDTNRMNYRYTMSNFFKHECPRTSCCMAPDTQPTPMYVHMQIGSMYCRSMEMMMQCPTGYYAESRFQNAEFNCGEERHMGKVQVAYRCYQ